MTYAVFDNATNTIAKDAEGYAHIYSTKEQAEAIARELGEGYKAKPI
jgi:ribosomal protein S24E